MFDRLYQENWLEQVTTKKGQSNWSIASLCSELVAKMAKDIGMTIRKGIVVPFLPCLVAFWGFHPYMFFHFFKCFFVTLYIGLLGIYIVYILAFHATAVSGLCVLAGVLVHYFLLATFFSMAADAILIFNKIIFVL